jgi:hypothetical protein
LFDMRNIFVIDAGYIGTSDFTLKRNYAALLNSQGICA